MTINVEMIKKAIAKEDIDSHQVPYGCPRCESDNICRIDFSGASVIHIDWECLSCEQKWRERYKFLEWWPIRT